MKEHLFSNKKLLRCVMLACFLLGTTAFSSYAESNDVAETLQAGKTLNGTIKDKAGEALIGVSVAVKGTTNGTITDIDGKYSISATENATLIFSYVGYKTQEIRVGSRSSLDIVLEEDDKVLDEVVVVGYGVQKKVNLTGSVSSISSTKIESRPLTNLSSALTGLSAGVSVRQSSGNPGSDGANIVIRGIGTFNKDSNGPLIIIDGAVGTLDSVNPDDVESINTLKDAASASIYGSRGANGVILVTTKRGKKDAAPKVTYTGIISKETPANKFDFISDYANYMELYNRATQNMSGVSEKYQQKTIEAWRNASKDPNGMSEWGIPNWLAYPNTDWTAELFKSQTLQTHNLSVTGGSANTNYLLSLGALDNRGIMKNTGLQRYNVRVNLETKINNFLKVGTQTYLMKQFKEPGNANGAFTYMFQTNPGMTPIYDGKYGVSEADEDAKTYNNLLRNVAGTGGKNTTTRINTGWYAEVNILDGLSAKLNANYQDYFYVSDTYSKYSEAYTFRDNKLQSSGPTLNAATVTYSADRNYQYTLTGTLNYLKTIGDHDFGALLGYEQFYYNTRTNNAQKKGLMDYNITDMTSASEMVYISYSSDPDKNLSEQSYAMLSYFGRLNYAYKGKYLLEANFRKDASSRFSPDSRWGTFPSFSGGWRISEESFMEGSRSFLDNLKLRASWGKLGNVTSGYYDWQSVYAQNMYSLGGSIMNGLAINKIGNPFLQWENINSTGVGLDATILRQRLNVELDVYTRTTEGILTSPAIYLTMGNATAPTKNTSDMRNRGIEISIGWNDKIGNVQYGVNANFSYNKNEIVKYLGQPQYGFMADENGNSVFVSDLGKSASFDGTKIRTEGHMIDEYFIRTLYKGTGAYKSADGKVDPNGGPTSGMIRTPEDMQWVKDMQAAGYTFSPKNNLGKGNLNYGEYIYADKNGDKNFGNNDDRVFTGKSATPKYGYGLNLTASWKGVDFGMTWAGNAGQYYYIHERGINKSSVDGSNGEAIAVDGASKYYFYNEKDPNDPANNIHGRYPSLKAGSGNLGTYADNDAYLYNGSYLKLTSLQIGYTLPKNWMQKIYVSNLRVFLAGENLLTITDKFPGLDPELGDKVNIYPIARQFSAGVNLTF